jgi:hypothetical protein
MASFLFNVCPGAGADARRVRPPDPDQPSDA